jgi:riboflavin biosynthesis pyrimidine reductase
MLAAGLVDEVHMDVAPVVIGPASAASGRSTHSTCWRIPTW